MGLAAGAVIPRLVRRDLGASKLQFIAFALTVFNFVAMGFIVIGRTAHMHASPGEIVAPRYMFWSSLLWPGLFLIFVQNVDSKKWARWPTFSVLSALPLLIFPEHYQAAAWGRHVHLIMEPAATSLINGVCDTDMVAQMYPTPATVYSLAKQYRQRRLDMFAGGLQDWIGVSETNLFGGHYKSVELKGSIAVQSLVRCANGAPAARVTGWAIERETSIPKQLILVNAGGKVCGLARPTEIHTNINSQIYCLNSRPADFLVTFAITIHKRLILFGVLVTTGFPGKLFALLHPDRWLPASNASAVRIIDAPVVRDCKSW